MPLTSPRLTDDQFNQLRKIIHQRSGIWFADNKRYVLETRLSRRIEDLEMNDFGQYVKLLTIGPWGDDEFQEMFNRITINETSLFRNPQQLAVFEKRVLPVLLESRRMSRKLRIWSAACSSGEEPYTLAIMIHRTLGVRLMDWHIEVLGTDISEKVLMAAQDGWYGSYATRNTDPLILRRYFKEVNGGHSVNDEVRSMVRFEKLNLKDQFAAKRHGVFDVVFCRNVMIYFDTPMRDSVHQLIHHMLAPDGTLWIGHSETIRDSKLFSPLREPESFAYAKM